ncbi:MAG: hypothetical protein ISR96_13440 [Nitrospira sp.]|nr:hypothetical protein [Nitrospira sp.]
MTFFILLLHGGLSLATNSATQTITFQVLAINEISVSGDPDAMTISFATAGSALSSVTDTSTTYSITTNESSRKITGQITTGGNMPSGVILEMNLSAPTGGSSSGYVTLDSSSASDLVTAISTEAELSKTITYRLSATIAASAVASDTRVVTLSLTD